MNDKFNRKIKPGDCFLRLNSLYNDYLLNDLVLCRKTDNLIVNIDEENRTEFISENDILYKLDVNGNIMCYLDYFSDLLHGRCVLERNKLNDIFGRKLVPGDLVLFSIKKYKAMYSKTLYGIVFSDKFIYTEYGFLNRASYVYLVENPTLREKKKKDKLTTEFNKLNKNIGAVGAVYQNREDNSLYIDLGICNVDFIVSPNFKYLYDIDKKYFSNNHIYLKLYCNDYSVDKNSYIYNILYNNLSLKGKYNQFRYYMKSILKDAFVHKIDKQVRKQCIIGYRHISVNTPSNRLGQCVGRIENIEYFIFNEPFVYKDYQIKFYR